MAKMVASLCRPKEGPLATILGAILANFLGGGGVSENKLNRESRLSKNSFAQLENTRLFFIK